MATRGKVTLQTAVWGLIALVAVGGLLLFLVMSGTWWAEGRGETAPEGEPSASPQLLRDAGGRPKKPYTLRLSQTTVTALKVTTEPVRRAGNLLLPPQGGSLGYDTDRLYAVRPRFQGEVIEVATRPEDRPRDGPARAKGKERFIGPGDWVTRDTVLAVIWSKEIGDRKVALVSALLDLYLDEQLLKDQEPAYKRGSLAPASFAATRNKVEKDLSAINAAEAGLGISRLAPKEIEDIRREARVIQKRLQGKPETTAQRMKRLSADVKKWAKVEIVAPRSGIIVEKNTNVNDMVDPSKDTPLFKIADLSSLLINVNFNEEYLPLLQPLLKTDGSPAALRWKVQIEADSSIPLLDLPVLRIARSLDPSNHTALVVGRISNPVEIQEGSLPNREPVPGKRTNGRVQPRKSPALKYLLVGQFVTATVEVPPGKGLVDIPTNALNEVNGESLVLVQPKAGVPEYVLRRVAVARRSRETTQVRRTLTPQEQAFSQEEEGQGRRPLEELHEGERVVTQGVTEITDAFEELVAKARVEKGGG